MVQSHKILTVSYGTFSCTLEGFDDAFGTMKAIAEYFRDLAAEDRYFGAEPPQPDAQMLAHIAQTEIARRVDAHHDESGIVLRAQDAALAAAPAVAEAAQPDDAPEKASAEDTREDAPAEPVIEDVTDTIVAELAEAEAELAEQDAPAEAAPAAETEEIEPAQIAAAVDAADAVSDTADDVTDDAAAFFAPGADAEPTEVDAPQIEDVAEPAPAAPVAADSIAAKLQRIRAVVSKGNSAEVQEDFSEDEHADPIDTPAETVDAKAKIAEMLGSAGDEVEQDIVASDDEDEFLDDLNERLDALDPAEGIVMDTPVSADDSFEEDLEDAAAVAPAAVEIEPEAAEANEPVEDEAPAAPLQARVVKVSKEEFDAILASDRGEDIPTVDLSDTLDGDTEESSLSPEDEEDLMRELAALEAEIGGEPVEDELDDDDIDSIFAEADADLDDAEDLDDDLEEDRAILSADVDSDANVSRLLEEADDKLSDSETSDRRSEFAHLRAAMAAGKAEEEAGGSMSEAASDESYREDLARVVKPRRPESGEPRERSRRPQDEKPAPLKLVAAQRVDAETAPVQPRRVMSSQAEDMSDDADGKMKFADYAEGVGAHELPDLLEAAAAYLSFVEGQDQFSRPQLMTKVRMVENQEFSREDGLRSFGLLLRDGKIEKTQAGRFTVSDRIGFRPEDMRAAG